ncbi:hypothetical protein [Collimonas silvisoli]|uniref:hypothetical protein n=1 Tax=Collimonas silvisoli TaxID=2825884 RepID=UPI001B8B0DAE|nr:hypothetical protein [Collimonas silvisoli]
MGLLSLTKGTFLVALESTRDDELAQKIEKTINDLSKVNMGFRQAVSEVFLKQRAELLTQKATWSTDMQAAVGRGLQVSSEKMSRQASNSNDEVANYGLWLAGAWLETGALKSESARVAHFVLEEMIKGELVSSGK